jgi:hypothetical protein
MHLDSVKIYLEKLQKPSDIAAAQFNGRSSTVKVDNACRRGGRPRKTHKGYKAQIDQNIPVGKINKILHDYNRMVYLSMKPIGAQQKPAEQPAVWSTARRSLSSLPSRTPKASGAFVWHESPISTARRCMALSDRRSNPEAQFAPMGLIPTARWKAISTTGRSSVATRMGNRKRQ